MRHPFFAFVFAFFVFVWFSSFLEGCKQEICMPTYQAGLSAAGSCRDTRPCSLGFPLGCRVSGWEGILWDVLWFVPSPLRFGLVRLHVFDRGVSWTDPGSRSVPALNPNVDPDLVYGRETMFHVAVGPSCGYVACNVCVYHDCAPANHSPHGS